MKKWFLPILIFAHLLYLQALTFYPYPELFTYPYLVTKGFVPYRDILDQHFPTLLMLPINLWSLGMRTEFSAKLVFFALIVLTHILIYTIARKLVKKDAFALVPSILYVALQPLFNGSTLWIDTFITPLTIGVVLCIILAIEEGEKGGSRIKSGMTNFKWWIYTGLLLGIVFTMKQTVAAFVAGILTFLLIRNKTRWGGFVALVVSGVPPLLLLFWVYQNNLWTDFSYWTLTFNTHVYSKMAVIYPNFGELLRVILIWGSAYLLFFWSKKKSREMVLFFLSSITLSFFAIGRFGLSYLQVALPFISLLISVSLFNGNIEMPKKVQQKIGKGNLGIITFIIIIIFTFWHMRYFSRHSQGESYFANATTVKIAEEIKKRVQSNDHIFIFGGNPILYPLTDTVPSGNVYTVLVPWNYSVAEDRILQGLEDDPPKLVVVENETEIDGKKGKDFGKEVLGYIEENYEKQDEVEGYTFYLYRFPPARE